MGRRLALLVGTFDYVDTSLQRLIAPGRDVEDLAEVLADPQIADFNVTKLINRPHHEVGESIGAFYEGLRRDDLGLLYITGHGVKDDQGRLFLAMTNSRRNSLLFTAIGAAQINDAMNSSRSRQKVLILDCCYGGAFPGGWTPKGSTDIHSLERFEGRGRVVLTASDASQYSFEGEDLAGSGARSLFTRYLVEGIRSGQADLDGDGDVCLDELYSYVHDRVVEEMPQQRPKKQEDIEGRIIIARNIEWVLPVHVQNAIASPIALDRRAAVRSLAHLYRVGNDTVRERVLEQVEKLTEDDSRLVAADAADFIKTVTGAQEPQPQPQPQPQQSEQNPLPKPDAPTENLLVSSTFFSPAENVSQPPLPAGHAGSSPGADDQGKRPVAGSRQKDASSRDHQNAATIGSEHHVSIERDDFSARAGHIANLQAEIRQLAAAQQWHRVLTVNNQLAALDPAAADPDHLATIARRRLANPQALSGLQPPALSRSENWPTAAHPHVEHELPFGPPPGWTANPGPVPSAGPAPRVQYGSRRSNPKRRAVIWTAVSGVAVLVAIFFTVQVFYQPTSGIPHSDPLSDDTLIVARTVDGGAGLYPVDAGTGQIGARLAFQESPVGAGSVRKSPWPLISPDRRSIVYIVEHSDAESSIRVMSADGAGDRDLFTNANNCQRYLPPAWNPVQQDELGLICITKEPMRFAMRVVKLDGSLVRDLEFEHGWIDDISYSPDGSKLAYFGGEGSDGAGSIFVIPADGSSGPINLTEATTDRQPMWAPDGREIVFSRLDPDKGTHTIFVMNADGSNQRAVTDGSADDYDPAWSPDGKTIAFRSNRNQDDPSVYKYFLIDSAGNNIHALSAVDTASATTQPAWGRR